MATPTGHVNRHFGPQNAESDHLINNDAAARNFDSDEEPGTEDEDEASDLSEAGQLRREVSDWCAAILYGKDTPPAPLRINWNDYETTHNAAAGLLGITIDHLLHLHHVRFPPQDLLDADVKAMIVHRFGDITAGSSLQLTLLDVEFHAANPMQQPEVVRRVVRFPRSIGRLAILHRLGLAAHCRSAGRECLLWHNHDPISHASARPLALLHGDYLRISLPPGPEEVQHIGTRCVASACHQGLTHSELCDRHAMYSLGWYDTIIGPPLVPLPPDEDQHALL